jgi:hypothetical protein
LLSWFKDIIILIQRHLCTDYFCLKSFFVLPQDFRKITKRKKRKQGKKIARGAERNDQVFSLAFSGAEKDDPKQREERKSRYLSTSVKKAID